MVATQVPVAGMNSYLVTHRPPHILTTHHHRPGVEGGGCTLSHCHNAATSLGAYSHFLAQQITALTLQWNGYEDHWQCS